MCEIIVPDFVRAVIGDRKPFIHKKSGRVRLCMGGKILLYHRVVMEAMMGRPLRSEEHVHHKDHNPLNNAPENLQLMTWGDHMAYHYEVRRVQVQRTCQHCGVEYTRYRSYGKGMFCSRACRSAASHYTAVCPTCGEPFTRRRSQKRTYCSIKCSAHTRKKHTTP